LFIDYTKAFYKDVIIDDGDAIDGDAIAKLAHESKVSNRSTKIKKTKLMAAGRNNDRVKVVVEGDIIEQVEEFKFLGSIKTANGDCTNEIKKIITMAKEKAVRMEKIWRSRNIKTQFKIQLIKALIWSVFLYGVESWTIKISDTNQIRSFEMWCWRRIPGVVWKEHHTDELMLLDIKLKRNLMARVAKLKLHVSRGSGWRKCR